jgi:hypothetical protein
MRQGTLWTVPQLAVGMDSLWTAQDEWTKCCPQAVHTDLGQVIAWTSDLPTAAWITARMGVAVTHTAHSGYDGEFFLLKMENKKTEIKWTKTKTRTQERLSQITPNKFQLTPGARHYPLSSHNRCTPALSEIDRFVLTKNDRFVNMDSGFGSCG